MDKSEATSPIYVDSNGAAYQPGDHPGRQKTMYVDSNGNAHQARDHSGQGPTMYVGKNGNVYGHPFGGAWANKDRVAGQARDDAIVEKYTSKGDTTPVNDNRQKDEDIVQRHTGRTPDMQRDRSERDRGMEMGR